MQLPEYQALSDEELTALLAGGLNEQRRRAGERGDFDAVCEQGFTAGFDAKGHAKAPVIRDGMLVCFGSIVERSTMSHECSFVHIDDSWVWEHHELLHDEVRKRPERGREHQRSVSILPALEGFEFDLVSCKMRNSVHQMHNVRSYRIVSGALELISSRSIKTERYH